MHSEPSLHASIVNALDACSSVLDEDALARFVRNHRLDPYCIQRLKYLLYCERRPFAQVVASEIPARLRPAFVASFRFEMLELVEQHASRLDGSMRLLFRAADGAECESVAMQAPGGRTTLCLSSQVGCAMGCTFCATGQMGLMRNLTASEIVAQVAQVNDLLRSAGRSIRNVVFMGMGEPLHNLDHVFRAMDRLLDPHEFALSPRRMMVSTVGICSAMQRFAERFPHVGLAVSLHSVRAELRQQLIPLARRYPLDELRDTLHIVGRQLKRPVMIEYLMLDGLNDQLCDARELAEYLEGMQVHINLIPFNPIDGAPLAFRPTPRQQRDRFAKMLRDAGYLTTIRYSQGGDISAACGQLVQRRVTEVD